jgi:hypothetical protein
MALHMPIWPWHGLRWAVGCFSSFGELGSFSPNLDNYLERVFLAYDFEVFGAK